jgi:TolA-binding protein
LGEFEKAAKFFEALEKVPETATEAGYWLGLTHKARREWAAAAEKLGGLQVATDHALAPAIAYHAADARLRSGDAAGAALAFDAQMAQWPASEWIDDAMLGRVQAALAVADHAAVDQWAARFEEQQASSPLLTDLRRDRANSLVARKQFAEAIALIEPIVASDRATFADRYLLAVAHAGAGRPTEALALLDPARGEPPAELRADALLARAAALVALERYEDAIAPLEACLALAPDASRAAKAQAQLAVCHGHARRLDQARAAYEALVALDPPAELLLPTTQVVADAALAAGDRQWSAELFAKLGTEQMPADFAAKGLSGLAWSQYEEGDLAEAAASFEELLRRYPEDALASEAALTRGQILEKLEQPEAALAMYQDVIDKHAQSKQLSPALLAAARLHATAGQDERAAELYGRWLRDHSDVTGPDAPARDAALYQAAWVERRLGRMEQGDALFQQLRAEHPQSEFVGDATYRLAERAIEAGDPPRAIALLDELLASETNPSVAQHALYLRGQVAVAARDWPGVATFMGRLVERFPDSALRPRAEYWVADALYKQDQFDAAAAALAALAPRIDEQREPWTAMIPLRRAQALVQQRKWADARAIAERIATDYPGFEQQFEVDYALGRCLAGLAEFQAAREAYRRVIDDPRGHGTETAAMAQWMIGETYYHQKEYAAALREFLKVEILYDYPVWQAAALLEAGKCHEHLGEWKQAAEMYARVVKEFPNTEVQEECERRLRAARERLAAKR